MRKIHLKRKKSAVLLFAVFIFMACWVSAGLKQLEGVYVHAGKHFAEYIHSEMKGKVAEIEAKRRGTIQDEKASVHFQKAKECASEYRRREIAPYQEGRLHIRHSVLLGLGLSTILLYLIAAVGNIYCLPWHKQAAWGVLVSHFLYLAVFVYELLFPVLILKKWQAILDPLGESIAPLPSLSIFNTVFNSSTLVPFMACGGVVVVTVFCLRDNTGRGGHKTESEGLK